VAEEIMQGRADCLVELRGFEPTAIARVLGDLELFLSSLRNVEDLLAERGIDISHKTVRFWWNRFGPTFAAEIRKRRAAHMRALPLALAFG
jgi:transposase-like protein